jgi:hypothetical protein
MIPKTIHIKNFKIITSIETKDKSRIDGLRKKQFRLIVMEDNKRIKSSYYATSADRNTAVRMMEAMINFHLEAIDDTFKNLMVIAEVKVGKAFSKYN